jgi:hypothetical protein
VLAGVIWLGSVLNWRLISLLLFSLASSPPLCCSTHNPDDEHLWLVIIRLSAPCGFLVLAATSQSRNGELVGVIDVGGGGREARVDRKLLHLSG